MPRAGRIQENRPHSRRIDEVASGRGLIVAPLLLFFFFLRRA